MNITETAIPGVLVIESKIFGDYGFFGNLSSQSLRRSRYRSIVLARQSVSIDEEYIARSPFSESEIAGQTGDRSSGAVRDVAVDIRGGSPLSASMLSLNYDENRWQFWVPRGFAHGFVVTSDVADFFYKSDELYSPADEKVLRWDDSKLGIDCGCAAPLLSPRDRDGRTLAELAGVLPRFESA